MPESANFQWSQQDSLLVYDEPYILPKEFVINGGPHNGLNGYRFIVDRFRDIEKLDFFGCHDLTPEGIDILCQGLLIDSVAN